MNSFQYVSATSVESAQSQADAESAYLAGGNDLLGLMKESIVAPSRLVNIKSLPGLDQIQIADSHWSIGALTVLADLENHAQLKSAFPALHEAVAEVGSPQIRNVATVGGNLAQHSRCWYFRHRDLTCWKKGGDTCHAREGDNRYHSLFSGCACISPVVSNLSIALTALNATVVLMRAGQEVRLTVPEFYAKSWSDPAVHNSLNPTDLILRVDVPFEPRRSAYLQISEKQQFDWALVSCAASAKMDGDKILQGQVVLGAVAPVPYQSPEAQPFLEGKELNDTLAEKTAELMLRDAVALAHNAYKIPLAKALVKRTLLKLKG
jgi:xanthine dehydrogenase YagS FAD-binding subunit